jgi:hypothetical protein
MSSEADEHPPEEKAAGMARRSFTDPICFCIFVAYMVGMVYIVVTSLATGNMKRLTHGFNYAGLLCGVDENVSAQPYLYWCGGDQPALGGVPTSLNLKSPICVHECPSGDLLSNAVYCPMPSQTEVQTEGQGQALTVTTIIVSRVVPQIPYETKLVGNLYCIPNVTSLATTLYEGADAPLGDTTQQVMSILGSIKRAWRVFIGAAIVAILISYIYLFVLNHAAKIIVYSALGALTLIQIIIGLALLSTAWNLTGHQADSPIFKRYPHDEAVLYSQISGGVCLGLGCLSLIGVFCASSSISIACGCVEAACECMFDMPSLLLLPITAAGTKLLVALILISGFMALVSCGNVTSHTATIGGTQVSGLSRKFEFTQDQKYMMLYYLFGYYWILELCNAMNLFIISYSVVLWYYKPKQNGKKGSPRLPALRGLFAGLTFHLGSLAFGACIIAIVQMVRTFLAFVQRQAQSQGNQVMAMIAGCLQCFMACFESMLKFLTKNAYIDIAVHSRSFCVAAKNSFEFIFSSGSVVALLNGACFVIQIIGALLVATGGGTATYILVTSFERYTSDQSEHWVSDPLAVSILAGILSLGIGVAFMVIFDQCADTLLYTYQDNKKNDPGKVQDFAPDVLSNLVTGQGSTPYAPLKQTDRANSS